MHKFAVIFGVLMAILLVVANVQAESSESDEDCYDEDLKISVKRGEVVDSATGCLRLHCPESGDLHLEPCELQIPPNCHIVDGDDSLDYPTCCPTVECD